MLPILGEIFPSVIDDVVRPNRARRIQIARTAHGSDFGSIGFGDLHCKRAHPTGGPLDQNLLSRLNLPLIAQALQGGDRLDPSYIPRIAALACIIHCLLFMPIPSSHRHRDISATPETARKGKKRVANSGARKFAKLLTR